MLHTARELEKQAVRLHQGWENALILNVDATFPFSLLAPSIAAFYRQHHATRLEFRRDTLGANWQTLVEGRADLLLGALGDPRRSAATALFYWGGGAGVCRCAPASACADCRSCGLADAAPPSRDYHRRRVAAGRRSGEPDGIRSFRPADAAVRRTGLELFTAISGAAFNRPRRATDNKTTVPEPVNRAWIGWNEDVCGQAGEWWRKEILANSAIHQVYNTKIV